MGPYLVVGAGTRQQVRVLRVPGYRRDGFLVFRHDGVQPELLELPVILKYKANHYSTETVLFIKPPAGQKCLLKSVLATGLAFMAYGLGIVPVEARKL